MHSAHIPLPDHAHEDTSGQSRARPTHGDTRLSSGLRCAGNAESRSSTWRISELVERRHRGRCAPDRNSARSRENVRNSGGCIIAGRRNSVMHGTLKPHGTAFRCPDPAPRLEERDAAKGEASAFWLYLHVLRVSASVRAVREEEANSTISSTGRHVFRGQRRRCQVRRGRPV